MLVINATKHLVCRTCNAKKKVCRDCKGRGYFIVPRQGITFLTKEQAAHLLIAHQPLYQEASKKDA
jgi:hypothetical protein